MTDKSKCPASGDAWYYDNAAMPTQILLCTTTCGTVSAGGEVDVLTGCQTITRPPSSAEDRRGADGYFFSAA